MESSFCPAENASQLASFVVDNYSAENHLLVASQEKTASPLSGERRALTVSLARLNKILAYDVSDLVISLESGLGLRALNRELRERGQFFPVIGGSEERSFYELFMKGDGGALETGFGFLRSKLLGAKLHYKYGREFRLGGKVVKNVTGYDLGKLLLGSRGSLGIASSFNMRLWARPQEFTLFFVGASSVVSLFQLLSRLFSCGFPLAVAEIFSGYGLPSGIKISTTQNCFLLLGVAGSGELVRNLVVDLNEALSGFSVQEYDFSHMGDSELKADIETGLLLAPALPPYMELAASYKAAGEMFQGLLEKEPQAQLRLRPACGRLYLHNPGAGWQGLLKSLQEILTQMPVASGLADYENFPLALELIDGTYARLDLGLCHSSADFLLKEKVRTVFDPLSCFAPRVNFQSLLGHEFFTELDGVKQ